MAQAHDRGQVNKRPRQTGGGAADGSPGREGMGHQQHVKDDRPDAGWKAADHGVGAGLAVGQVNDQIGGQQGGRKSHQQPGPARADNFRQRNHRRNQQCRRAAAKQQLPGREPDRAADLDNWYPPHKQDNLDNFEYSLKAAGVDFCYPATENSKTLYKLIKKDARY